MKLLYKTTRDYLIASFSILVVTGLVLFLILRKEISDEMNEQLELQVDELFSDAQKGKFVSTPFLKIYPAPEGAVTGQVFGDSIVYDHIQKMMEEYHFLIETQQIGEKRYQALAMTSHIGWDRYYLTIFYIFVLTALLLTVSGVLINYLSNKKIWAPFFDNLHNVQRFSVSSSSQLNLTQSSIDEFKALNQTLLDLTERSRKEYLALREFTENASHEIQTPLSIIQSKLDRISQLEVSEDMANYISQAMSGVDRLAKMNKSLLLLAKLDNKVFTDFKEIQIDQMIAAQVMNIEELFWSRQINVIKELEPTKVKAEAYLTETLISNLLTNTLRYTPRNGQVRILLQNKKLTISNTGPKPDVSREVIFERFKKGQANTTSTGLGLAIAQEICLLHQWQISFRHENEVNSFMVDLTSTVDSEYQKR